MVVHVIKHFFKNFYAVVNVTCQNYKDTVELIVGYLPAAITRAWLEPWHNVMISNALFVKKKKTLGVLYLMIEYCSFFILFQV